MRTRASAIALRDSLGQAFRQLGMTEYSCQNDGMRWQRPGLGVEFYIGAVFPDGLLRVGVIATPLTEALPTIMCPDAPRLPNPRGAPSLRRASTT